MNWKEIKDGWGLQEIPRILAKDTGCCMCMTNHGKLYTTERLPDASSPREYGKQCDALHASGRIYCRYHAEWYFAD